MKEERLWFWARGYWKVYIEDTKIRQKIERWIGARLHCSYFYPNGDLAWDFIIPTKLYNRIAELLGYPLRRKNGNRVKAGKEVQKLVLPYRFTKVISSKSAIRRRKKAN